MRRGRIAIAVLGLLPLLVSAPAWAGPSGDYGPPITQCTITDPEIDELSGLAALPTGDMLLVEDSTPEPRPGSTSILMYRLDPNCSVSGDLAEFDQDPRDVEDLAFRDNTVWFADIGDNGESRSNVALISVGYDPAVGQAQTAEPLVFRLAYPDGPHDAEALLLAPDGVPYIVTKELSGRSAVYRPAGVLDAAAEVSMEKVADLQLAMTGTAGGPVGRAGQVLVTGGAVAADGSHLALRTYTDAYVWTLAGNDVARALQADPIAVIALPDAPQGEAISFASDSRSLLVGSEGVTSVITAVPARSQPEQTQPDATGSAEPDGASAPAAPADTDSASSTGAAGLIAVGMVAVVAGATWLARRLRRKGP